MLIKNFVLYLQYKIINKMEDLILVFAGLGIFYTTICFLAFIYELLTSKRL